MDLEDNRRANRVNVDIPAQKEENPVEKETLELGEVFIFLVFSLKSSSSNDISRCPDTALPPLVRTPAAKPSFLLFSRINDAKTSMRFVVVNIRRRHGERLRTILHSGEVLLLLRVLQRAIISTCNLPRLWSKRHRTTTRMSPARSAPRPQYSYSEDFFRQSHECRSPTRNTR